MKFYSRSDEVLNNQLPPLGFEEGLPRRGSDSSVGQNFFGVSQDSIDDEESDRGNTVTINLPGGNRWAKLSDLVISTFYFAILGAR